MKTKVNILSQIKLPPVSQIGVIVRDIGKAIEYYELHFGIGPFTSYEFVPEKQWFMERPSQLRLMMGKAMWGDLELELIQPLEGESLHTRFLATCGEGLQHLGFNVRDYDKMFEKFLKAGFKPLMRAESFVGTYDGYLKACYFDTKQVGGIIFEIIWKSWLPECQ